ncbi:putative HTLV-1-related endogenous sequence [Gallus gallus]|uniref:putative HTLV-1-related endogenous sequence n=1 Tax=Gallus gallus TaxID=9031 RepID=UPI001AE161FC|nr:putative HTLV-1-related endogenous sequence [Gallus gallus]
MGTRRRLPLPTHDPPPPRAPPHPAGGQRGNPEQKRRRSAARHPRSDAGPLPGSALSRRPPPRAAGPAPLPPPHRPAGSAPLRSAGGEGRGLGRHGAARSRLRFRFRSAGRSAVPTRTASRPGPLEVVAWLYSRKYLGVFYQTRSHRAPFPCWAHPGGLRGRTRSSCSTGWTPTAASRCADSPAVRARTAELQVPQTLGITVRLKESSKSTQ